MVNTAKVITAKTEEGIVGLFDRVEIYIEEDDETETIQLMTTLRQNAQKGLISKESPLGKALMGAHLGERVLVNVSDDYSYWVQVRSIEHGVDDDTLPIARY